MTTDLPWSVPSRIEDNGVHNGYSTVPLLKGGKLQPAAKEWAQFLHGATWAVVSKLSPGGYLLPHRDKGPYSHRIQIPLQAGGWYWDAYQGTRQMEPGPNVVRHHLPHCVWNDGPTDRIHLVIDRPPIHGDEAFELYPAEVCPELSEFLTAKGLTIG